jgi:hypothetical protein
LEDKKKRALKVLRTEGKEQIVNQIRRGHSRLMTTGIEKGMIREVRGKTADKEAMIIGISRKITGKEMRIPGISRKTTGQEMRIIRTGNTMLTIKTVIIIKGRTGDKMISMILKD